MIDRFRKCSFRAVGTVKSRFSSVGREEKKSDISHLENKEEQNYEDYSGF